MIRQEEYLLNEIFARRYRGPDPKYAIIISHGIGGHGGVYDRFCEHHAKKGVDIWSYDAPGHGRSTTTRPRGKFTLEEWAESTAMYAEHVKAETGLPIFALGSSLGVAAAFCSLYSDAITGAILHAAPAIPTTPHFDKMSAPYRALGAKELASAIGRAARLDVGLLFNFDVDYGFAGAGEQKRLDPWNTWSYDLESWASIFTYDPKIPANQNTKPVLIACGGRDPSFDKSVMQGCAEAIAGPVEFYCLEEGTHQLMLFYTEGTSNKFHEWALSQI